MKMSVIIPVYNVESYLERCINSIITQQNMDMEIILVDDGSTDSSGKICDYYRGDKRFVIIHKKNGGVSSARNMGLDICTGEYITFIDPDDFIQYNTLSYCIDYFNKINNLDIVQYPVCRYIDEFHIEKHVDIIFGLIKGRESIFANWWSGSPITYSVWNKIFKRHMFDNIRFKEGHISEDTILMVDLYKRASSIFLSEKGMYYYQIREGSYTQKYTFESHIDLYNAHYVIYKELVKFPSLSSEKIIAYTRLYRRLLQAKIENPHNNINDEIKSVSKLFPSIYDIIKSKANDRIWLIIAKLLGFNNFYFLYNNYMRLKFHYF